MKLQREEPEEPPAHPDETALLSEAALAEDWNRPEEDPAWVPSGYRPLPRHHLAR